MVRVVVGDVLSNHVCSFGDLDQSQVCAEYMLLLPVPLAVDCLSSLAVHMGAAASAKLLGYLKTDGDRQKVRLQNCGIEEVQQ